MIRKDLNGDGIIDGKDKKAYPNIQRDRPTTTYGITLQAAWKGFDISMLFNGGLGVGISGLQISIIRHLPTGGMLPLGITGPNPGLWRIEVGNGQG